MANRGINYISKNFADIRSDLIDMVSQYYPDIFNDFNDASVGLMLLELNAAVGDMLSFNTDRMFQETQIDYAQQRASILSMARTFGLKVPGKRPSVSIVNFSVIVPVFGDTYDISYAPIISSGSQVIGAGKIFETIDDVDFSSPFNSNGIPNLLIIPNIDSNQNIVNYTLTKQELVVNGFTKIFQTTISPSDVRPFFEIVLPDDNVISVDSVITLDGTNYTRNPAPSQFFDSTIRWYEVNSLAESNIFIEDNNGVTDNSTVKKGKWVNVTKKFITEYTDLGFIKLIFGGGTKDTTSLSQFSSNSALVNQIGDFINNMSLGETPTANETMFIKYRVGGGSDTNLGVGVLNSLGNVIITVNGDNDTINSAVKSSLIVTNEIPALGGKEAPSVEEIRNLVRYNFSSQNRAVTIKDYLARIALMPGRFGAPFRYGAFEEQNKIKIYVIGLDANSKLTNQSTTALKENIASYLSEYRSINDYIEVSDGRIINLAFEIDLFTDRKVPKSQIASETISTVQSFMNINKYQMGENIYLSNLIEDINNVGGVLNVIDLRVFNKVGEGKYSLNETSQPYIDETTKQIDISQEYTLFGDPISMYEIKYPEIDIKIRIK